MTFLWGWVILVVLVNTRKENKIGAFFRFLPKIAWVGWKGWLFRSVASSR